MRHKTTKYKVDELVADEQFQNYCRGTNAHDVTHWEDLILSNWSQRRVFEQAYTIVSSLSDKRIFAKPALDAKVVNLPGRVPRTKSMYSKLAVFAAFMLVTISTWYVFHQSTGTTVYVTQAAAYGETKAVTLPDGSTARLNSHSSITYPADMSSSRAVSFSGEVYFNVKSTADRQHFTVSGDYGTVLVTGTEFNLKHRNNTFEATLVEGSITYSKAGIDDILLTPSEQLTYVNDTIKIRQVETDYTTDWVSGRMIFKNISISQLIKTMYDDYNVVIKANNNTIKKKKISANMLTSDPTALLRSIGIVHDFRVEEANGTIILK